MYIRANVKWRGQLSLYNNGYEGYWTRDLNLSGIKINKGVDAFVRKKSLTLNLHLNRICSLRYVFSETVFGVFGF